MAAFLTDVSAVVTASLTWVTDILDVVVSEPALLVLCIAVPIIYRVVDMFNRLIKL